MWKYLLISIGGALGSVARFWVTSFCAEKLGSGFPYGTLVVNLAACVTIGFLIATTKGKGGKTSAWRFLIAVGFIGAFSTFSTFEWETYTLIQGGTYFYSALYVGCSLIVGLLAVGAGTVFAQQIKSRREKLPAL